MENRTHHESSWSESKQAFAEAADWFVSTARAVDTRWSQAGLGEWDIRSLVGHTSRALLTVEAYLARPATNIVIESATEYFSAAQALAAGPDVTTRGREAGAALGPDPAATLAEIADRVLALLTRCTGTETVTTIVGGMRLKDYLPTRTFELAVHTADLATALSLPLDVPASAAVEALDIVARLAAVNGLAGQLLLASTGRPGLPDRLSVL